ncbi:MAG: Crp/Fnr family transcriptional regulator [Arenibacter algicola]
MNKNKLLTALEKLNIFEYNDIDKLMSISKFKKYKKGEDLVKSGNFTDQIFYLHSGALHTFFVSENSEKVTKLITFPDEFIASYTSILKNEKSKVNIQALTDVEVIIFKYKELKNLFLSNPNIERFSGSLFTNYLTKLECRYLILHDSDAKTRYLELLQNKPEFILNLPLRIIASYLAITPRHLSRIRASTFK